MKKQTEDLKIYKMICKTFGHKFSFNAKNLEEAMSKKSDYAHYHSHNAIEYSVEETTETKWIHNEYVN